MFITPSPLYDARRHIEQKPSKAFMVDLREVYRVYQAVEVEWERGLVTRRVGCMQSGHVLVDLRYSIISHYLALVDHVFDHIYTRHPDGHHREIDWNDNLLMLSVTPLGVSSQD
jgi:hypothetical protein